MSLFEEAMALAVQLPVAERERLAQALGVSAVGVAGSSTSRTSLPLHSSFASRLDPVAWRKAERGHAVLATDQVELDENVLSGPQAIAGMWTRHAADRAANRPTAPSSARRTSQLPIGSPVVVHTDVCLDLALGVDEAVQFFADPPVEVRLTTATYLALLGAAEDAAQQRRLQHFVQPYAVLSLGPMASSRAVVLMLEHALSNGLTPLDALIAATALAHEIPLLTYQPQMFANISGLEVCRP